MKNFQCSISFCTIEFQSNSDFSVSFSATNFHSVIQCHFDYCCSSWFSSLSAKWKHKLQVMQNKIIRFILKLEPRSHIGREEFEKLAMLKVEDRIKQLKLNHVYKIYHDEAPEYLISHFRKFSNIHRYSTRGSSTNLILPKVKGQACNSFFFTGITKSC